MTANRVASKQYTRISPSLEAGNPKPRLQQGKILPEALRESLFLVSLPTSAGGRRETQALLGLNPRPSDLGLRLSTASSLWV